MNFPYSVHFGTAIELAICHRPANISMQRSRSNPAGTNGLQNLLTLCYLNDGLIVSVTAVIPHAPSILHDAVFSLNGNFNMAPISYSL